MAVVTGGKSRDNIDRDYKFDLSRYIYTKWGIGEVVFSDTFANNGTTWQLEMKKTSGCNPNKVNIECQLHLVNTTGKFKPTLARICLSFCYSSDFMCGSATLFQRKGDKSGILSFQCGANEQWVQPVIEVFDCLQFANPTQQIQVPKSQMANVLLTWFADDDFGDTAIVASDGKKFRCHKEFLSKRSEVFRLMFTADMKEANEGVVTIDDFDGDIVTWLLHFVYIDDCGEIGPIANRLYAAAHKYQLERLKILCESALAANLSADTFVETYRLANFYHLDQLKAACAKYLDNNKADLPIAKLFAEVLKVVEVSPN